jgi:nitroreductase
MVLCFYAYSTFTAVNEGIGACFVGAFQDNKVSEILSYQKMSDQYERIDIHALVHYEKYGRSNNEYCNEFIYEINIRVQKTPLTLI